MPIVEHLMSNLKKQYGDKKGESVYYAMENSGKIDKIRSAMKRKKKK